MIHGYDDSTKEKVEVYSTEEVYSKVDIKEKTVRYGLPTIYAGHGSIMTTAFTGENNLKLVGLSQAYLVNHSNSSPVTTFVPIIITGFRITGDRSFEISYMNAGSSNISGSTYDLIVKGLLIDGFDK